MKRILLNFAFALAVASLTFSCATRKVVRIDPDERVDGMTPIHDW